MNNHSANQRDILEGAKIAAAIMLGDDIQEHVKAQIHTSGYSQVVPGSRRDLEGNPLPDVDPSPITAESVAQAIAAEAEAQPAPPSPGDIPAFFKPALRFGIRRKLWTRFLVKMFSKKLSRTSKVGYYDETTKALVRTERVKGRSKLERRILRYNLTHESVRHGIPQEKVS